jgi:hypothetical protein
LCIREHRNTPQDKGCGPCFGEIDHYKLLMRVINTGPSMPFAFGNIFEPVVRRPANSA